MWRTKGFEPLLVSLDYLIVLEKLLQHCSINMQHDDESPPLLLFLLYSEDNSVAIKSNLINRQQSGDGRLNSDEFTNTPRIQ